MKEKSDREEKRREGEPDHLIDIMKEMKREKHASYCSHDSCKSLSEELSDYYRGSHSSNTKTSLPKKRKGLKASRG